MDTDIKFYTRHRGRATDKYYRLYKIIGVILLLATKQDIYFVNILVWNKN